MIHIATCTLVSTPAQLDFAHWIVDLFVPMDVTQPLHNVSRVPKRTQLKHTQSVCDLIHQHIRQHEFAEFYGIGMTTGRAVVITAACKDGLPVVELHRTLYNYLEMML